VVAANGLFGNTEQVQESIPLILATMSGARADPCIWTARGI
jgi:hypothetical protein